jgi:hypothetical protein
VTTTTAAGVGVVGACRRFLQEAKTLLGDGSKTTSRLDYHMEQAVNIKSMIAGNDAEAVGTDSFDGAAGDAKGTTDNFPLTRAQFAGTNAKGFIRWLRWDAYILDRSGDAGDIICGPESQAGS